FKARIQKRPTKRIRIIGDYHLELGVACYLDRGPAILNGRIELLRYVAEQSISRTRHRFGNLITET
ncbi:MAG: hypothetical protein ACC652_12025, partial [Acidimicrobiales bacterium]